MEWTTAASVAIRLGKQGYDFRHTIQEYWTKAKAYIDRGSTQIVVTGHAAAGKTMLVAQMHGRARELGYEIPAVSRTVEVDAITLGDWTKLIRVLPGQTTYRTHGEIATFENNPELEGVIHIVDFGYVTPRDPVVAKGMVDNDGIDTVQKLRSRNLQLELIALSSLLSDIRKAHAKHQCPKWIVIAVNKVDLFPQDLQDALHFYHPNGTSDFAQLLRSFQTELGERNFGVYLLQTCASETDFCWNGTTIASSLPRNQQMKILSDFMRTISEITEVHK